VSDVCASREAEKRFCQECGQEILDGEPWESHLVGRYAVYGRIGEMSSKVTGMTQGHWVHRCKDHLLPQKEPQ
jgi:hypothetical protein